jgi:predicted nucleic acid-binding Zn ribbon protein
MSHRRKGGNWGFEALGRQINIEEAWLLDNPQKKKRKIIIIIIIIIIVVVVVVVVVVYY